MYERLRGASGARLSYQSNYLEIVAAASKYPFISMDTGQISISVCYSIPKNRSKIIVLDIPGVFIRYLC